MRPLAGHPGGGGVIREAQYDAQCAECGGKITAGDRMEYLPPSAEWPARTSHPGDCPDRQVKQLKQARNVNHAQRVDPEDVLLERECDRCRMPAWVDRTDAAARAPDFVGRCCDGTHGEESVTHVHARNPRGPQKAAA